MKVPYLDLAAQMAPIRSEVDEAIRSVLDDLQFTSGSHVKRFEENFAKYCGNEFCCGVNSGTSALHLALRLLNIEPGDEVITTSLTFIATSWAISYVGAKPVFVDVHSADSNINVKLIEAAITPKTKAIIVVHLYGNPCEMDKVMEIANKHGIPVVED
jgi:dTDP-4-amino-4,6-dideoxygalactose transaminase